MLKRFSLAFCLATLLVLHWLPDVLVRAMAKEPLPPISGATALAIIVNKSNPVENISSNDLRSLLLAEQKSWPNGRRVTIVMREPNQPERITVLKVICRMTGNDYDKYFLQAQFAGDLQAIPKMLATETGVCKFVFNVPGAIGYVRVSEVNASVKVMRVDGRLPGEPGYKLKVD